MEMKKASTQLSSQHPITAVIHHHRHTINHTRTHTIMAVHCLLIMKCWVALCGVASSVWVHYQWTDYKQVKWSNLENVTMQIVRGCYGQQIVKASNFQNFKCVMIQNVW